MAMTYAAETQRTNVRVTIVNPGPLRTRMRAEAMPGENPETLRTPEDLAPEIVRIASPAFEGHGGIYDFPTGRMLAPQPPA
jgi:NAD(P)-dependent dehydrogenase (short-subunit alcohol dehydrogenase family)